MVSLSVNIYRGKLIESKHKVIGIVKNIKGISLLSTNNDNDLIYPRSSIKIFQAIPFIKSGAKELFNLNSKNIAISCSSHHGENQHLNVLQEWFKKINIKLSELNCGVHNPINLKSSNNLLLRGKLPNELHNNCSGKHLGMISGCIANKINHKNYTSFNHPYQKIIRETLERYTESKILKQSIGTDGCNAPQYAFPMKNLCNAMLNIIKEMNGNNENSKVLNLLISSINSYPELIGGSKSFDSNMIKITKGRIFCKGGAEGVLLFADFAKQIGGVIKVIDGNDRARPSAALKIFSKLNLILPKEKKLLKNWQFENIYNHKKIKVGEIKALLK